MTILSILELIDIFVETTRKYSQNVWSAHHSQQDSYSALRNWSWAKF